MKELFTKYTCDSCGKVQDVTCYIQEGELFEYERNKIFSTTTVRIGDNRTDIHSCSNECLYNATINWLDMLRSKT